MPSTYTSRLRIEKQAAGENNNTWGDIANLNFGELVEEAIAGVASVAHNDAANYSLSTANGAADEARRMVLNVTGTLTAARNVVAPSVSKLYVVRNATAGGFAITIKTSSGVGVTIPNGSSQLVFCDGTDFFSVAGSTTGGGTGGSGTSKVAHAGVALGMQAQAQSGYTYYTVNSVAARGLVSQFRVTMTGSAGPYDLVVRGAPSDTGTLHLDVVDVQRPTLAITLPFYYENDGGSQQMYIGIRHRGAASSATFTLANLRVERFA